MIFLTWVVSPNPWHKESHFLKSTGRLVTTMASPAWFMATCSLWVLAGRRNSDLAIYGPLQQPCCIILVTLIWGVCHFLETVSVWLLSHLYSIVCKLEWIRMQTVHRHVIFSHFFFLFQALLNGLRKLLPNFFIFCFIRHKRVSPSHLPKAPCFSPFFFSFSLSL